MVRPLKKQNILDCVKLQRLAGPGCSGDNFALSKGRVPRASLSYTPWARMLVVANDLLDSGL